MTVSGSASGLTMHVHLIINIKQNMQFGEGTSGRVSTVCEKKKRIFFVYVVVTVGSSTVPATYNLEAEWRLVPSFCKSTLKK